MQNIENDVYLLLEYFAYHFDIMYWLIEYSENTRQIFSVVFFIVVIIGVLFKILRKYILAPSHKYFLNFKNCTLVYTFIISHKYFFDFLKNTILYIHKSL